MVGKKLVQLGVVSDEGTKNNIIFLANLLVGFSRAGLASVLSSVLRKGENNVE
jgi:hypothetical protein